MREREEGRVRYTCEIDEGVCIVFMCKSMCCERARERGEGEEGEGGGGEGGLVIDCYLYIVY